MAKRELKPWHYQVTTVLAVITLLCVVAYFVESFRTFFMTERDPVLIAVERIKGKVDERSAVPEAGPPSDPESATDK